MKSAIYYGFNSKQHDYDCKVAADGVLYLNMDLLKLFHNTQNLENEFVLLFRGKSFSLTD